jgi:hypothetical protein
MSATIAFNDAVQGKIFPRPRAVFGLIIYLGDPEVCSLIIGWCNASTSFSGSPL